jgi:hypothetical protein
MPGHGPGLGRHQAADRPIEERLVVDLAARTAGVITIVRLPITIRRVA